MSKLSAFTCGVAVATVGVAFLMALGSASADSTFTPTVAVRMCNAMPATFPDPQIAGNPSCAENLTASAASDITTTTDLSVGDVNFDSLITFSPSGTSISGGGSIPAGTKIGGVHELVTLGLANATCSTMTTRDVVLFNVALPDNTGSPYSSTNLAYPEPPATFDRFSKWKIGSPPGVSDPNGIALGIDADHAGASSVAIQGYPEYLLDMLGGLVPQAVYGGLTRTEGEWNPLYLVQFNAGQLSSLTGAYSLMNATMGQPAVWVSGDPTATPWVSNITDTCTPLSITTTLLGQDPTATYTRATSPSSAATAFFLQYATSQRDLDQDGFENALDTCPLNPNIGSPKTGGGDVNGNGIDAVCDPNDNSPSNNDVDGDALVNRLDNCPQAANTIQTESEMSAPADNGPRNDGIGDACDSGTAGAVGTGTDHCTGVAPNMQVKQNGQCISISLSTIVANGRYLLKVNAIPKCIGGPDLDGDGYCSAQDNIETGTCASTSPPSCTVRHNAWSTMMMGHPGQQMDSDKDGYSDVMETYMGTDATKSCAQDLASNNEAPLDNWPPDFNDDTHTNLSDILKFGPVFNASVNATVPGVIQPSTRFDFNNDGQITLSDVLRSAQTFSFQCGVTIGAPSAWAQQ